MPFTSQYSAGNVNLVKDLKVTMLTPIIQWSLAQNKGHYGAGHVVLCREVVLALLGGSKCISPMGMVL